MKRLRLLLLNYEYPPLGGGGSNATKYLLKEFAKRDDIHVDAVTSSATGSFEQVRIGEHVVIHKLPIRKERIHYWTQKEVLEYSIKCKSYMRKLLKENSYDACHAFFGIPCGAIAMLSRKKIPYIVSLRGSDVPGFNKRFSVMYIVLKPLIRLVWRKASAVVANSKDLADLAHRTDSQTSIGIIANGVDIHEFSPKGRQHADRIRILCVSRLIERKGVRYLIDAAKLLKDKGITFHLTLAGKGDQEEELREYAKHLGLDDDIAFLGFVEHDDLADLYKKHDVFILPSLNEGMSNALLEAMASGLAIITTDTGGIREIIEEDSDVFFVPMHDAGAIAASVHHLADWDLLSCMQAASRRIAEKMSWKDVADAYMDTYIRVIRGDR